MKRRVRLFAALAFFALAATALLGALGAREYDESAPPALTATVSGRRVGGVAGGWRHVLTLGGARERTCDWMQAGKSAPQWPSVCGAPVRLYCDGAAQGTFCAQAVSDTGEICTLKVSNGAAALPDRAGAYTVLLCVQRGGDSAQLILRVRTYEIPARAAAV